MYFKEESVRMCGRNPIDAMLFIFALILMGCGSSKSSEGEGFTFRESPQGIELSENGDPLFFYQREPRSPDGEFFFNNYLHPLYSLDGDTLTEEFPEDHLHHRGVFWAWHQIYVDDESIGDGWMMENITQDVEAARVDIIESNAVMVTRVLWRSSIFNDSEPFLEERSRITVYPLKDGVRILDFEISLAPLVGGFALGGSDDEKGYGGFSARLRLPDDLIFTSEEGRVTPQILQIRAGSWLDFSGSFGRNGEKCGVTLVCDPETPNYPAPWILRQKKSMQNIVFPGRERVSIPEGSPVVLKYRMILHQGGADLITDIL